MQSVVKQSEPDMQSTSDIPADTTVEQIVEQTVVRPQTKIDQQFAILEHITGPIIKYGITVDSYLCHQLVKMMALSINPDDCDAVDRLDGIIDQLMAVDELKNTNVLRKLYRADWVCPDEPDDVVDPADQSKFDMIKAAYRNKMADKAAMLQGSKRPMFHVGQIVGARDREKRWWMAKIHEVYEFAIGRFVYLVEYLNWGREFDEVLDERYIRYYNRWIHTLYSPAYSVAKNNWVINPLNDKQLG